MALLFPLAAQQDRMRLYGGRYEISTHSHTVTICFLVQINNFSFSLRQDCARLALNSFGMVKTGLVSLDFVPRGFLGIPYF